MVRTRLPHIRHDGGNIKQGILCVSYLRTQHTCEALPTLVKGCVWRQPPEVVAARPPIQVRHKCVQNVGVARSACMDGCEQTHMMDISTRRVCVVWRVACCTRRPDVVQRRETIAVLVYSAILEGNENEMYKLWVNLCFICILCTGG